MEVETEYAPASSKCLICNVLFERKPIILEDEGSEEHLLEFKGAFRLFCKLLKTHQLNSDDEDENKESDQWTMALTKFLTSACKLETILEETLEETSSFQTFTQPCCDDCHATIVSISELQKIIEDKQNSQRTLVESLGKSLMHEKEHLQEENLSPRYPVKRTSFPSKLLAAPSKKRRKEELHLLRGSKSTSKTRTQTKTEELLAAPSRTRDDCQVLKTCFVQLTRCDDDEGKEDIASSIHRKSRQSARARVVTKSKLEACDLIRESSGNRRNRTLEKTRSVSKVSRDKPLNIENNDCDSDEYVPPATPSSSSRSSSTFLNEDFDSKGDDSDCSLAKEAESRGESGRNYRQKLKKVEGGPMKKTQECKKPKRCDRSKAQSGNWFKLINEDTLLFKNSLIDVTLRRKMTCLEEGCSWYVDGSDYHSFQQARDHVNRHSKEEGYEEREKSCPVCNRVFPGAELWHHFKHDHKSVFHLVCDFCWRGFHFASFLELHFASHKESEKDVLNAMDKESAAEKEKLEKKRKRILLKNQNAQIPPNYRRSNGLWKVTETRLLFKNSLIKVNLAEQRVECEEEDCGVNFEGTNYSTFEQIRAHVNNCHLNEPTYTTKLRICPACETGFYGPTLKTHAVSCHNSKIICEICWKPFEDDEDIQAHKWLHKNDQEKEQGRADKQELKLNASRKQVENRKSRQLKPGRSKSIPKENPTTFPCDTCGKEFKHASYLRAHLPKHLSKELREKFECSYCGWKVLSALTLRNHIQRQHRPDLMTRQHVCSICDKKFHIRDRYNYRRHVRRHTNERPFVCETCGKCFSDKDALKLHWNVHLDQRSYQCEYCEMAYKHKNNLKRHQKSAHKEKMPETDPEVRLRWTVPEYRPDFIGPKLMFPCEFCEKVFPLRSRMTKHVKLVHPNLSF